LIVDEKHPGVVFLLVQGFEVPCVVR
jgi:hypothetical protein